MYIIVLINKGPVWPCRETVLPLTACVVVVEDERITNCIGQVLMATSGIWKHRVCKNCPRVIYDSWGYILKSWFIPWAGCNGPNVPVSSGYIVWCCLFMSLHFPRGHTCMHTKTITAPSNCLFFRLSTPWLFVKHTHTLRKKCTAKQGYSI